MNSPGVAQEHLDEARRLVEEGWYQTSRKHRIVCRLPETLTAEQTREVERMGVDFFLRVYLARGSQWKRELDAPTFAAFRQLGGGTYPRPRIEPEPEPETVSFEEAVSDPFCSWPGGIAGR